MTKSLNSPPCATVLIVEDDGPTGEILRGSLTALGHNVTVVATGVEAIELCQTKQFDCMLLDVGLEGAGGVAVAQRLGGNFSTIRPTHVYFISGRPKEEFADALRQGWADGYVLKPASGEELAEIVLGSLRLRPLAP